MAVSWALFRGVPVEEVWPWPLYVTSLLSVNKGVFGQTRKGVTVQTDQAALNCAGFLVVQAKLAILKYHKVRTLTAMFGSLVETRIVVGYRFYH